jgi:hypothetical protein
VGAEHWPAGRFEAALRQAVDEGHVIELAEDL